MHAHEFAHKKHFDVFTINFDEVRYFSFQLCVVYSVCVCMCVCVGVVWYVWRHAEEADW